MTITYTIDLTPSSADEDAIFAGLLESNAKVTGYKTQHYSVFARNEAGKIVGGALVYVGRDSAFVDSIWVDTSYRLQGMGRGLLNEVESEAKKRNCVWVKLDTYEFQAPQFYLNCGYEIYGEVKDYTCGQSKIFLRKRLSVESCGASKVTVMNH